MFFVHTIAFTLCRCASDAPWGLFTTSVSVRKGHGQHAVIKIRFWGMTNGPIRAKQVSRSSSVIDHMDELASTTC